MARQRWSMAPFWIPAVIGGSVTPVATDLDAGSSRMSARATLRTILGERAEMELRVDADEVSLGGSKISEIGRALIEPTALCESALESAAAAAHDPAIASVIYEIFGLTQRAHGRLEALVAGVGERTRQAGDAYQVVDADVAHATSTD